MYSKQNKRIDHHQGHIWQPKGRIQERISETKESSCQMNEENMIEMKYLASENANRYLLSSHKAILNP